MSEVKIYPARKTPEYMPSIYCNTPEKRAYDLPGMVSVSIKDLFPDMPDAIYVNDGDDLSVIDKETRQSLEHVDMSDIKPDTSVNIVCSEHGFVIYGGRPYLQMLKTLKEVVKERTGCRDIRLRVVMYRTPKEGEEVLEYYNLREEFDNNLEFCSAYDKAVPIPTRLGTFYGNAKAYDADKFIYAYYDDPREFYASRVYRKSFKAFTMNMARYETRSAFHFRMGGNVTGGAAAMAIPMSIFDSDFVQSKYTFSCFLRSTPNGVLNIDSDNDLYELDNRTMGSTLKYYSEWFHLLREVEDFTCIIDGGRWAYYVAGAGMIAGSMNNGGNDWFDLHYAPADGQSHLAPGYKAAIVNQAWTGLMWKMPAFIPCFFVGEELNNNFKHDPANSLMYSLPNAHAIDTIEAAMEEAQKITGTDKFMIFDGSFGFFNCSKSVAEELFAKAPAVRKKVEEELYPMYMEQRGLSMEKYGVK